MRRIIVSFVGMFMLFACSPASVTPVSGTNQEPILPTSTISPSLLSNETVFPMPTSTKGGNVVVVCNNAPSDSLDINTAIENSAKGDEILISGQCMINQTIKLIGHRSYRGTSRSGTVLRQADGANLAALLVSDSFVENRDWATPVYVEHLMLDGNRENNSQAQTDGIILRSWLSVINDVYIANMSRDGLRLANKSADGTQDIWSGNGRLTNSYIENSGRHGVYVEVGVTDWNLTDNWIGYSGVDGLHLEDVAGWVIERNHIYGVPGTAIHAEHLFGTSISDNQIEHFGETTEEGTWYGIYATVQGQAVSTISNNRIFNISEKDRNPKSTYHYIALTVNYDVGMISVTGNVIRGANLPDEIGLSYSGGGSHKLIVTSFGNLIEDVKTKRVVDGNVILSDGY